MSKKIPCGGFYLDDMLNVDENGKLGVNGGEPYKQLVTDGSGRVKWEDRLAYEETVWKDFTLNGETEITGFTMPPVGDTVTVKVNGVESVETVKSGELNGNEYPYIGTSDIKSLETSGNGWIIFVLGSTVGLAKPETTISLLLTAQHQIDEKYIQQDKAFVRYLSYYTGRDCDLHKIFYKESGDAIITYKCNSIIVPLTGTAFVSDELGIGLGTIGSVSAFAFYVSVYFFQNGNTSEGVASSFRNDHYIFGTDETEIAKMAAQYGYTLTTKPTT